jgi:hypothetical protein
MDSPIGAVASLLAGGTASVALVLAGGAAHAAPDPSCTGGGDSVPPCPNLVAGPLTATVVDRGRSLQIADAVTNAGSVDSPPTTYQVTLGRLALPEQQLEAVPVKIPTSIGETVPIPADLRGTGQAVTLVLDPANAVGELEESDNTANTKVFLPSLPDLRLDEETLRVVEGGTAIDVHAVVSNGGGEADGTSTSVEFAAGDATRAQPLSVLAVGASASVDVMLPVAAAARGQDVAVTVTVDPADLVAEGDEANNRLSRSAHIPAPPQGAPDLSVSGLRLTPRKDSLSVHGVIANLGDRPALGVHLALLGPDWARGRRSVARLDPGAGAPVDFTLAVPESARGHGAFVRLRADPAQGERNLANNERSARVTLPGLHRGSHATLAVSVGAVLLGLSAGLVFLLRARRMRVRGRWQREASDDRPETCEVPQSHVLRTDCKLKPALREVASLELAVGDEVRIDVEGAIVDRLNDAVRARRLRRHGRMQALVEPLGEQLAAEIERWLAESGPRDVAIGAHIKEGKLECEFTRSECVREGDRCRWRERQHWKGELEHEAEEPVCFAHVPLEPRPERVRQLSAELLALVLRVDVPRRTRAPEVPAALPPE